MPWYELIMKGDIHGTRKRSSKQKQNNNLKINYCKILNNFNIRILSGEGFSEHNFA